MNLREYLLYKNMTQTEFAKRAGITRSYLSRIMSGAVKPTKHMLLLLEDCTDHIVSRDNIAGPGNNPFKDQQDKEEVK